MFQFGEDLFDGVEIGGIEGGKNRSLAPLARMARRTALPLWLPRLSRMTTSPGFSVGARNLIDIGPEALAVDWTIENPWGLDTSHTARRRGRSLRLPVTVRDVCREPPAPRAPTSDGSHVGLDPGFIDEDETGNRINHLV